MSKAHLRRKPTQERSRRRLESIVEAAARLFAERGFEKSTIEDIAALAETSVGSVYQFFPNKLALFRGVSERCFDRVRTLQAELVTRLEKQATARELVDGAIDGIEALVNSDPAFRAVWANSQLYPEIEADDRALEDELAASSATLLRNFAPQLSDERAALAGRLIVETIGTTLILGARRNLSPHGELAGELKIMLHAYLEVLLGDRALRRDL